MFLTIAQRKKKHASNELANFQAIIIKSLSFKHHTYIRQIPKLKFEINTTILKCQKFSIILNCFMHRNGHCLILEKNGILSKTSNFYTKCRQIIATFECFPPSCYKQSFLSYGTIRPSANLFVLTYVYQQACQDSLLTSNFAS